MLVVAVNNVEAFFEFVYKFECFAGGCLAVVIEADHVIAGSLCVTSHECAMLAEVLGEADSLNVAVGGGKTLDDVPYAVGTAVVYKNDFVVGVGAGRDGFADFVHHGFDGVFAAVAGDYKRELHYKSSHLLLCAERAAACIMARPSCEVLMPQTY